MAGPQGQAQEQKTNCTTEVTIILCKADMLFQQKYHPASSVTTLTSHHQVILLIPIAPPTPRDQPRQRSNGDSLASGLGPKSRRPWRSEGAVPYRPTRGPLATPSPGALFLIVFPQRFGRSCLLADSLNHHSCPFPLLLNLPPVTGLVLL